MLLMVCGVVGGHKSGVFWIVVGIFEFIVLIVRVCIARMPPAWREIVLCASILSAKNNSKRSVFFI